MPRSIWKGVITFGMVSIPVRLFPATQDKDVSFHLLHQPDHSRIKFKRWCETEDKEVEQDELVRAFEVSKGQYVEITDEDLARALDITVSAVRQHLNGLAASGFVTHRPLTDGPGRPRHLYLLSAGGEALFPKFYGEVTNELLSYVEQEDPTALERIFERRRRRRVEGAVARLAAWRLHLAKGRDGGVGACARTGLKGGDFREFGRQELDGDCTQVLPHALRIGGLGDDDGALGEVPGEHDLGRRRRGSTRQLREQRTRAANRGDATREQAPPESLDPPRQGSDEAHGLDRAGQDGERKDDARDEEQRPRRGLRIRP